MVLGFSGSRGILLAVSRKMEGFLFSRRTLLQRQTGNRAAFAPHRNR